jgi:polyribonucleotide nucleotidyltransferase
LEDHYGDMDFKVAGTSAGITALQLDIKVEGLTEEILKKALYQAKEGRQFIMGEMNKTLSASRSELSDVAPKIEFITINPEKVGVLIGPGGKMIKRMEEETGATIFVTDGTNGQVSISAKSKESLEHAKKMIIGLTKEVEAGEIYQGKVVKIMPFGAFIELVPGKEGLLHISKISKQRIENVEDVLSVGEIIEVVVREIDGQNRINLAAVNPK